MKFERPRVQTAVERHLGCADVDKWKTFAKALDAYVIKPAQLSELRTALEKDSEGYFIKGLITVLEAVAAIDQHRYSWAVVRLYYSIFYLNRASLGVKGFALIRNGNWVLLRIADGASPTRLKGDRYRNDHDAVISTYIDRYKDGDFFQSNSVDDTNPYKWLSERRNQINYQQVEFIDPVPPDFVVPWLEFYQGKGLSEILSGYTINDSTKIFQPEHAWIAIPFMRAKAVIEEFLGAKRKIYLRAEQWKHLQHLNRFNLVSEANFGALFPVAKV